VSRTYVLLILEVSINNLSGTDGHRAIGRTWHSSHLQSFSQEELILLSTNTRLLTRLKYPLTRNVALGRMIPIGRYLFLSGLAL
jgi:hypothetical protein